MFKIQLILAISLQLCILIRCIIKVVRSDEMSSNKKLIWISIIVLLQMIGTIFYYIANRKKTVDTKIKETGLELDENVRHSIFLGLFYTFEFLTLVFVYLNPDNVLILLILLLCTLMIFVIYHFGDRINIVSRNILPYILITLITIAQYLSVTENYGFILLIAVAVIIMEYPLKYSVLCTGVLLAEFLLGSLLKIYFTKSGFPPDYLVDFLLMNIITFIVVAGAFYIAKRQLVMSNYLRYLMLELKEKSHKLEEASALKERNRIAREIHDTLGHTLTGAIIQLEVAKKMVYTSPEKAEESIQKTQDITRQGFTEVKRAINALRPIMIEENTLDDGLRLLFRRIERDYNFIVNNKINLPEVISEELKVSVYRIVQELITNSIRHGQADGMDINIEHQFDNLRINTNDNGEGCSSIKEGNGLLGIRERVEKLGGHAEFSSGVNEGFSSIIYIPI